MNKTSVIIYVQRNVGNVEVVVCGRVQSLPGVGDKLIFSVADINGKGIELTLDEYETAADALYAHICEAIMNNPTKPVFVGTCANSFDDDGVCLIPALPWVDISAFALADEGADTVSREFFHMNVEVPADIKAKVAGHVKSYLLTHDHVWMIYDEQDDIHYFFV